MNRFGATGDALLPEGVKLIAQCTQLKELEAERGSLDAEGAKHLTNLKQLESLNLNSCGYFSSEAMEHVGKIHSLKKLVLNAVAVGNVGISHLSSCSKLESLKITCCGAEDDKLDNEGVRFLKNLPSLKKLEIPGFDFTSDIFSVLSEFPSLEEFTIRAHFSDDEKNEGKKWGKMHNVRVIFT